MIYNITEEEIENIETWGIAELWNIFRLGEPETDKEHLLKERIKNGFNMNIDIRWIINEWYEAFPKTNTIKIKGFGTRKLDSFLDEKELREDEMRKNIIDNLNTGVTEPRGE